MVRFTVFCFFLGLIQLMAGNSYSQTTRLSLNANNEVLENVLEKIEDESEFFFLYNKDLVNVEQQVNIKAENETIKTILDNLFKGKDISYVVYDRQIVLSNRDVISKMVDQNKSISGKVTDSGGQPLPGVAVVVKGTTQGTVTNADGNYSLTNVSADATLSFSFVGMKAQEIVVGSQSTIDVTMQEEAIGIGEVVAIGYGTQKKADVVGSIVSVSGEEINKTTTSNFAENLQGRASGVMVSNSSGHPGAATDIKIRGINSISLASSPLWIIDGIPIFTSTSENTRDGVTPVSALSMVNANDIASIEILKDAAATAIYGSRGSGGVILITTKSGQDGAPGVRISYDGGLSQIPFSQNDIYVTSEQYWEMSDKQQENLGLVPLTPNGIFSTKFMGADKPSMTRAEALEINTDHLGSFTQVAQFHQFGITANKSFRKGGVMFSLNYRDEKGLIVNNDLKRLTSRFNFNFKPIESMELGFTSNLVYLKTNGIRNVGGKTAGGWHNWTQTLPWMPVYDDSTPTGYWGITGGYNMAANADRKYQRYDTDEYRAINNIYAEWAPLDGLKIRGEVGVDLIITNSSFWRSSVLEAMPPYYSQAEEQSVTKYVANGNLYANYNKTFSDIHNVDLTIGAEANRDYFYSRAFSGAGLQTIYPELINPMLMIAMKGYQGGDNYMQGFFARANYKLSNRYLLNASVRRDGISAFSSENRWSNFYAVGAGWILSNEDFMSGNSIVSLLKLRGSYGITGNTAVSNEMTYMQWGLDTNIKWGVAGPNGSTTIGPLGSAGLKWETTANTDIGIDYGLFGNRINGSFAYYTQNISDLILLGSVQPSVGLNSNFIYENVGDMKNHGVEFNVSTTNISKKNFSWRTDFNISTNKNEIVALNKTEKGKGKVEGNFIRREGESLNTWYLANYAGIDVDKGIPMIDQIDADKWTNEDITVTTGSLIPATESNVPDNKVIQTGKTPLPTFYGGLNNTLTYKNFDFNILLSFSGGNWIMNDLYRIGYQVGVDATTIKQLYGNTWEKPGDVADWPQLIGNGIYYDNDGNPTTTKYTTLLPNTTRFLEKGDYIRARNIQLGYTLPESAVRKVGVGNVRIYVGANNLFTITGYKGLDPESLMDLPIPRTFNFGISLNL